MTDDELICLLIERKALIVHCSRPGKADEGIDGLLFPADLKNAAEICGKQHKELSCSLVWPTHVKTFGAIGIVLKAENPAYFDAKMKQPLAMLFASVRDGKPRLCRISQLGTA